MPTWICLDLRAIGTSMTTAAMTIIRTKEILLNSLQSWVILETSKSQDLLLPLPRYYIVLFCFLERREWMLLLDHYECILLIMVPSLSLSLHYRLCHSCPFS